VNQIWLKTWESIMQRRTVLKGISVVAAGSAPLLNVMETLAAAEVSSSDSTDASGLSTLALPLPY
jgi:hypothetical protein